MRINRYKEKIEYILEALNEIPPEPEKPIEISGTFYNLLTAIEAAMDIAAMLVKDLGKRVEDDYSNIDILAEIGVIDNKLAEMLKMCNGLRNWLVHRYNRIDTRLVLESVEEVRETLTKYIEKVERVLDEIES
ncbi:type VII toxin-antitoxin system HepT family RNase toxin [Archaeoglobus veneficus]|uniref:DUF86 domain-containing protein n=1 Tax=Archaeoglobus veneficus (strain DSM 11195 / SNP6) TaxID=693661 RepID=F2KRV4_ARCVS|nr:DUF86 domain-containing protein [Archaeoglobus veneficus]AEA47968.1 protein of unknown function DUF86 [Archaeoglobus veneficus SNP6]